MSAPSGEERCAPAARRRGDDMAATAAPVTRWLLVEQPGHWGRDAVLQSLIDPATGRRLSAAAAERGVRVVLIRRPGRFASPASRAWGYADSRPGHESLRWGTYADHAELLDGPLDGIGGEPDGRPAYLVCAHGRHDACCAIRGRPVAAALRGLRPGRAWECSHIGGDRFAANVVVLPEGLYYGQAGVGAAATIVSAHEAGEVVLPLLRGRSSLPAPVQAAQHHARSLLDERRIAALAPLDVQRVAPTTWRVTLARHGRAVVATVRAQMAPPQLLTCSGGRPQPAQVFRLLAWEP
ncbi:MAG: sucrase ferredoxin [Pseudonocardiales bacterium]|nr:MAG: sucrase ferredoxin [Pseudonocardiales bacterium]